MDILKMFHEASWQADYSHLSKKEVVNSLENGRIIFFPQLSFELTIEEQALLSPKYSNKKSKNISLDYTKGTLSGALGTDKEKKSLMMMMQRFRQQTLILAQSLLPVYFDHLRVGRTSFRPVEILGRKSLSYKKDDTRLHVDAFPATPNQGQRILRIFTNINPHGQYRLWHVGEPFEKVASQFLPKVTKPLIHAWLLKQLGLTKGIRTDYDHIMLQIHDRMKADYAYQKRAIQQEIRFPAGSTWIVKTDVVSHAAISGQHLLEQTFYLPVQAMENEYVSPLRILERLTKRQLA